MRDLGIYRQSGHEHLCGSLVVPITDADRNVVDLYGRKLSNNHRAGVSLHLLLGDEPRASMFNVAALAGAKHVIVCGGVFDALTFWRHGYRSVVAVFGDATFDGAHVEQLASHDIARVFIAFRRSADGDRAASRAAALLAARGVEAYRVVFPRGMDANDIAVASADAREALVTALRNATWLGAGEEPAVTPWGVFGARADDAEAEVVEADDTSMQALLVRRQEPAGQSAESAPTVQTADDEVTLKLGERLWRVRGLSDNTSLNTLKVNLLVVGEVGMHIDVVQLYAARQRSAFVREAAAELGVAPSVIKRELGKVLLQVESVQEERIAEAMTPEPAALAMSAAEREQALQLLRDPALLDRVAADLDACGIVGERVNKRVGYLALLSRKLPRPIGLLVRSSSAAGKTTLSEGLLALVPPEDRVSFSAMTGQSLYYMPQDALKHRVLSVAEDEGAKRASYALKLLQSDGGLTIASTSKDAAGRMVTEQYVVAGPTQIMLTSTAIDIDEELVNRCIVLSVDEGREQTRAIQQRQRQARTLDGMLAQRERQRRVLLHHNARRLIEPLVVVNPYAERLTFVDFATRTRREHAKYLALIDAVALAHQHQRTIQSVNDGGEVVRYVAVELRDIAIANALADEVLGRSLDELPPQTRQLLTTIDSVVADACNAEQVERRDFRFTRRWLRERVHWSDTQLRVHLRRLVELECVIVHGGGRGRRFLYELCWDGRGDDGSPHLSGLIDPSTLS